jgi:hypothetical protein
VSQPGNVSDQNAEDYGDVSDQTAEDYTQTKQYSLLYQTKSIPSIKLKPRNSTTQQPITSFFTATKPRRRRHIDKSIIEKHT